MPELTIVIPVFDRDEELRRALRSISSERREIEDARAVRVDGDGPMERPTAGSGATAVSVEVILVDDGSSPHFAALVAQLAAEGSADGQRSIRIPNRGPSAARNAGLRVALGDYVMFLDSDDELAEGAMDIVRALLADGGVGTLCGAVRVIATDGRVKTVRPAARPGVPSAKLSELAGSFVVRTDIAVAVGGYDVALRFGENTDFILLVADECRRRGQRLVSTDAVLSVYHEPSGRRRYDAERYEAAVHLLHRGRFDLEVPAQRASVQAIAAVNAARTGRYVQSVKYAAGAVRSEPRNPRHLARLALACTGPLAKRRWLAT